jgi:hypothetical protein
MTGALAAHPTVVVAVLVHLGLAVAVLAEGDLR